jgi:hypothetical protein
LERGGEGGGSVKAITRTASAVKNKCEWIRTNCKEFILDVLRASITKLVKSGTICGNLLRNTQISTFTRRVIWECNDQRKSHPSGVKENTRYYEVNRVFVFYIGLAMMLSITIYLDLIKGSVEKNPGPQNVNNKVNKQNISIVTFNTNGLGDRNKLKRLLNKLNPLVEKGSIIFLQETHIVNTEYLKSIWKNGFQSNCVSTNSAGVIILFNSKFKVTFEYNDHQGRQLVIAIEDEETKFLLVNV